MMPKQERLPEGTVTFLFTDIEASTRLWEQHPQAMGAALARHDALLRQVIEANGGRVFKTVGDEFCAAFSTAPPALAAAAMGQRALQAEVWRAVGPLQVRMAVHTGAAEARDGDYFGPALNRVSRLLEIGHGGQILLSQPAYALARDHLPEQTSVKELGEHRLKDLVRPETIFQLSVAGLPADHPPLTTLDTRRHNLPVQRSPLIGREREVAAVQELLRRPEAGLVTLTGPSGCGKTRLGLQVAAEILDAFPDGVFFVPLGAVSDPQLIPSAIAQTLDIHETAGRSLVESLQAELREKQLLLLLDNFEQVLEAGPHVAGLLAVCRRLKVLVTSRAALLLRGEKEFPVPPLPLPDPKHLPPPGALSQYAAVALFVQRALDVKSDFAITNENAPAVAEICQRLDGLPLAIELAAARIRLLPPQAMLSRLESRLKLLTGGARDLPARQQTLRGAIAWSYDLLEEDEKRLFRRQSVFVGGCCLDAVEAICDAEKELRIDLLEGVGSLVNKSLLLQEETGAGEPRFTMLETIREFGGECLIASGESAALRRRHAAFYLQLAESGVGRERVEAEHDNLRAALSWLIENQQWEDAIRLGIALFQFWYTCGFWTEGRERLTELLALAQTPSLARSRGLMLRQAGQLSWLQGDSETARSLLEESLTIIRELGDAEGLPASLNALGEVARCQGEYAMARSLFQESLAMLCATDDRANIAWSLHALGEVAYEQGDIEARSFFEESLALFRAAGSKRGSAYALGSLGAVARIGGDMSTAQTLQQQSLVLLREVGHKGGIARSISDLGALAACRQDGQVARSHFVESLAIFRELGNQRGMVLCLERIAKVEAETHPVQAARLLGAAEAARQVIGAPLPPVERAGHDATIAGLRAALGDEALADLWAEGHRLTLHQAVDDALQGISC